MASWIWVLIPLAAIMVGAFKEWLKFKSKQEKLGTSTHELEETVRALEAALEESEAQRAALTRRLENVETIVTSQTWDALHEADEPASLPAENGRLALPDSEEPSDTEKAERLARRLKV